MPTTGYEGWRYRLEITGPCNQYYTREALLTVNAWPTAQIAPVDTLLVCGGVPTQLHGNPAGGSGTYTAHRWFGDIGPLSQYNIENPVFNTTMAGYYRLVYQVTDSKGCVGLDTLVIEVEKPVAMFTADVLSGCQPLTVSSPTVQQVIHHSCGTSVTAIPQRTSTRHIHTPIRAHHCFTAR